MPETITCPRCQRNIKVPDQLIGRWITCAKCGMEFAAVRDDPEPETDSDIPLVPGQKSWMPIIVISTVVAAILLTGIGLWVVYRVRSGGLVIAADSQGGLIVAGGISGHAEKPKPKDYLPEVVRHAFWRVPMTEGKINELVDAICEKPANTIAVIDDRGNIGFVSNGLAHTVRNPSSPHTPWHVRPEHVGSRLFWIDIYRYSKRPTREQIYADMQKALDRADFER